MPRFGQVFSALIYLYKHFICFVFCLIAVVLGEYVQAGLRNMFCIAELAAVSLLACLVLICLSAHLGRGMKNGENFELLYKLADKCGAAG